MNREDTVRLQTALLSMGYEAGPIDGIMGPKTICASSQFVLKETKSDGVAKHAFDLLKPDRGPYVHGIDVSGYQGDIDWKTVSESGMCSFAIVKISEGTTHKQKSAQRNLDGARAYGIPTAGYHYSHPDTNFHLGLRDAELEAKNFASHYGGAPLQPDDLIPWIDFESGGIREASKHEYNVRWLLRFIETVKSELGCRTVGIYTASWVISSRLRHAGAENLNELAQFPLWWAEYRSETTKEPRKKMKPWAQGSESIWQWTGKGRVPGIAENFCDRNKATAKSIEKLKAYA
tara:strand:+ start:1465 stop:2334 length:870 start_codon:yes stop_codon:yes gene_type:complete